ncbi:MAG: hypothetical protein PVG71_05125 [Anaerolineae bacterium]
MKRWRTIGLTCLLVSTVVLLVGCGANQATPTSEVVSRAYISDVLDAGYEGALDVVNQLALGTLQLEQTEHAVTPEQAKALLPLWQALQGGVTAEGEISAVLKGIEGAMTDEQLATIADMRLTQEDMQAWMEEQDLGRGGGFSGAAGDPDARATRQAEYGGETVQPGGEVPPEMATLRAQFEDMSEEEREEMRATRQAGGGLPGGRAGAPGGAGRVGVLIRPLIEMLTERAG